MLSFQPAVFFDIANGIPHVTVLAWIENSPFWRFFKLSLWLCIFLTILVRNWSFATCSFVIVIWQCAVAEIRVRQFCENA